MYRQYSALDMDCTKGGLSFLLYLTSPEVQMCRWPQVCWMLAECLQYDSTKNISVSFSRSSLISAIKQSWQTSLSPSLVCRNSSHPKSQTFQGTTFPFGNKYSLQYSSTWSPLKIVKKILSKKIKKCFFCHFWSNDPKTYFIWKIQWFVSNFF